MIKLSGISQNLYNHLKFSWLLRLKILLLSLKFNQLNLSRNNLTDGLLIRIKKPVIFARIGFLPDNEICHILLQNLPLS